MSVFLITRHDGAVDWVRGQGISIDQHVAHLVLNDIQAGDTVIGSLPVHLAAAVCARQATYMHLSLDPPYALRGKELSSIDLDACKARLETFKVVKA